MKMEEYHEEAMKTAVFTHEYYPFASLMIEAAEFSDLVTKPMLRGDEVEVDYFDIVSEAGDVLWNLVACLEFFEISLEEVAEYNLKKLKSRQERGVLKGSGGNR